MWCDIGQYNLVSLVGYACYFRVLYFFMHHTKCCGMLEMHRSDDLVYSLGCVPVVVLCLVAG